MTLDEFFEKLPKDGWIATGRTIRSRHESLGPAFMHCPISRVAGSGFSDQNPMGAGRTIGLPEKLRRKIIHAADARGRDYPLRARLLKHCGLTEVEQPRED